MGNPLPAIKAKVHQALRDEFVDGAEQDFQEDELDLHIADCLVEISQRRPYEVKETKTTKASRDLDISTIEDLLEVDKVEFPVGSDPPDYRNVSIFGDTLTIDIDTKPTADQTIYLFCLKLHQLTEVSSTLPTQLESLLVTGVVAKAALGWINQVRDEVKEAIARITDIHTAIGNMTSETTGIEQAIKDLATGRTLGFNKIYVGRDPLGDYATFAARELGNANAYLAQSQGYLRELTSRLSISGVINSYQTWANNKLALYRADLGRLARARTYTEYRKG